MTKNDLFEVEIEGFSADGGGVCHVDGMAVFVAFGVPGDRCEIRILKAAKTHAFAKIERMIEPSVLRVEPDCPVFGRCGGCAARHMSYAAELEFKRGRVAEALERIGGVKIELPPVIGVDGRNAENALRNKATYQLERGADGRLRAGFFRRRSNDIVSCERCLSLPEAADRAAQALVEADGRFELGGLRWLMWRGNSRGECQLCVVSRDDRCAKSAGFVEFMREKLPEMVSLTLCLNPRSDNVILSGELRTLFGEATLREVVCGAEFEISPFAFFQTNRAQAEKLYEKACEFADCSGKKVLELYCGIGTLTLALARTAASVTACEIVPEAVENAKISAKNNRISNVEFICADAGEIASRGGDFDVVVVDPPRKGLDDRARAAVAAIGADRIVYVSCDPATLARDVKALGESGYSVADAQPVDMFPGTEHVETVCLLSHKKEKNQ